MHGHTFQNQINQMISSEQTEEINKGRETNDLEEQLNCLALCGLLKTIDTDR